MIKPFIFIFCLLVISCSGKKEKESYQTIAGIKQVVEDTFVVSKVIPSVTCNVNSSLSYSLFLPAQYDTTALNQHLTGLPVMIFLDPHADGSLPISKYQKLAEEFGVILIGSNDSKNGLNFERTNEIVQALITEAKERFRADTTKISLCGFSGGAKAALVAAMSLEGIETIIYCGAGLPAKIMESNAAMVRQAHHDIPPALGFAGVRDLNYTEVIETDEALEQKKSSHALIEWKGKHEWVDSISFKDAFYWLEFRINKGHDPKMVADFISANKTVQKEPLTELRRLNKMIAFLDGEADVKDYVAAHEALVRRKDFQAAVEKARNEMQQEMKMKQDYIRYINEKDLNWWRGETARLMKVKGEKEAMSQRLLGYVSLACYSMAHGAMNQGDMEGARKIVAVYNIVDPDNQDAKEMEMKFRK